jgi:hypothetical protein
LLGEADVNIKRMQVGVADVSDSAVAVLEISQPLPDDTIGKVDSVDAIQKFIQISM